MHDRVGKAREREGGMRDRDRDRERDRGKDGGTERGRDRGIEGRR